MHDILFKVWQFVCFWKTAQRSYTNIADMILHFLQRFHLQVVLEELCTVGNFLCINSFFIISKLVVGKVPAKWFQLISLHKRVLEYYSHRISDTSVLPQMQLLAHDISKCVCKYSILDLSAWIHFWLFHKELLKTTCIKTQVI